MRISIPDTIEKMKAVNSPRDVGVRSSLAWSLTGAAIDFWEKVLGINVSTQGAENLVDQPALYVVNHFTRTETFVVPYILYRLRKENTRSLAHHSLFKGAIGRYISRLGAVSTKEELRNRMIIGDLMTGRKNWVIYPEGLMVKNKKFMDQGSFMIETPRYKGPPRTGAAVLALRAELYRRDYLKACSDEDIKKKLYYENRYNFSDDDPISRKEIVVSPINITYYPIRPKGNKVSQLASSLFSELPDRLNEELQIEGPILLGKTDMRICFEPAISLERYLVPHGFVPKILSCIQGRSRRMDQVLLSQRQPLTNAFMASIYQSVEVNLDHLFCCGLLAAKERCLPREDFHKALLLTVLELRRDNLCYLRKALIRTCVRAVLDLKCEPLDSIVKECVRESVLEASGHYYLIDQDRFESSVSYREIRLCLTAKVIANEFEPLRNCTKLLAENVNFDSPKLARLLAKELQLSQRRQYEDDYAKYFDAGFSRSMDVGESFDLWPGNSKARAGVLLIHGYLAAPPEMLVIGESLRDQGYHCHGVRLAGHGTVPQNLADVSWRDWMLSVHTAYAMLLSQHERVYIVGFSMGGLLALLAGAEFSEKLPGLVTVNAALRLKDNRAGFAGAAVLWNAVLGNLKIDVGRWEYVENDSANPKINYSRNYIKGVEQLGKAIKKCEKRLHKVKCPTLVIQASDDPVVDPVSARIISDRIGSSEKCFVSIDSDLHAIVTGSASGEVSGHVVDFINTLEMVELESL